MNNTLIKEAFDVITNLLDELTNTRDENHSLRNELASLRSTVHREKLANELEKKSLLSYGEIEKIKNNEVSDSELENFEKLSTFDIDPSYLSEKLTIDHVPSDKTLLESPSDTRRASRSEYLLEKLQTINY